MTQEWDRLFTSFQVLHGVAHALVAPSRVEDRDGLTPAAWDAFYTLQGLRDVVEALTLSAFQDITEDSYLTRDDVRRWRSAALGYVEACVNISTGYGPYQ